jgi:hypothetical protein
MNGVLLIHHRRRYPSGSRLPQSELVISRRTPPDNGRAAGLFFEENQISEGLTGRLLASSGLLSIRLLALRVGHLARTLDTS